MAAYFVTGTDTAVGKTLVSAALLHAAAARGWRAIGIKPVAAGCEYRGGRWVNPDAVLLQESATIALDYQQVNPVALRTAMAPHLAAAAEGATLAVAMLATHCHELERLPHDLLLAEGAGGWQVPLNDRETMADLAAALGWPVLLVVGMRLGCLNHALLTAAAIRAAGVPLAGWIANCASPPMLRLEENIAALDARLGVPRLGSLPWLGATPTPAAAASYLDVSGLPGGVHAGV